MKKHLMIFFMVLVLCVCHSLWADGINIRDTKMLSQPAVSKNHIAFVYAGDLWISNRDGSNVHRLTSDEGIESNPIFSPDGRLITFNAQYDGNIDVFIVPVEGGIPQRLTYHPSSDNVCDFTPDGSSVLFRSSRSVFTNRYSQLFTISIKGGFPQKLKIPNAYKATYSPDGKRMAYTPLGERFGQWKNYRGGTVSTIWLYTIVDHSVEKIPQPEGRCNDTDPMWIGNKIYFRSDRNGEFNLFSYDTGTKDIKQLTHYPDFPVLDSSLGNGKIIYEQAAHLHLFTPENGQSDRLKIGVAADLLELRPRYISGTRYVRNGAISPSGARAVFEFRGEISTFPNIYLQCVKIIFIYFIMIEEDSLLTGSKVRPASESCESSRGSGYIENLWVSSQRIFKICEYLFTVQSLIHRYLYNLILVETKVFCSHII